MLLFGSHFSQTRNALLLSSTLLLASIGNPVAAGTLVRVSTSLGDFTIELLDETAPLTVQNFLNYVRRGDFNQTYIHRMDSGAVIQGGGYRFQPYVGPIDVVADLPVMNEFGTSNTRGTIAMAKFPDNPNSATNQWFFNLADNSTQYDSENGGYTVFGTVLGDGMETLDAISQLPIVTTSPPVGVKAPSPPYITETYSSPTQFVYVNMEIVDRFSSSLHVFEADKNILLISANIDNGTEIISLNMSIVENGENVIFAVNRDSIVKLRNSFDGMASYSSSDLRLRIPVLEVYQEGSIFLVTNVLMRMTNQENLLFTLESYEIQ